MKHLHVYSDIHFEFHRDNGENFFNSIYSKEIDGVILAGDITTMENLDPLRRFADLYPIVFHTPGNHEYYRSSVKQVEENLRKLQEEKINYKLLMRNTEDFFGHKIHGTTLWFPYSETNFLYERGLNDFRLIKGFKPWVYNDHEESVIYLDQNVKKGDIIVTHHLPTNQCVDDEYKGDVMNRFYCAELDNFADKLSPSIWIHGHSHTHLDKVVGETRFIRNPHGYLPYESHKRTGFQYDFMINLEEKNGLA